jgi:branched-chain amino acid transport system permease protein
MSALSWAIGSSLAALAGVLLVAGIGLDYLQLTLLIITAYAAAVLGKLENLPLTFLGSLILGLATSYAIGYLPSSSYFNGLRTGLPAIFLFLVLVLLPRAPLRVGQIRGIKAVPIPSAVRTAAAGAVLIVAAWALTHVLSQAKSTDLSLAFCYGSIMLSAVLLTGYAGYLSLAPVTFAGVGALTMVKLNTGQPWALLIAAAVTAAVGAVIGLFAIRLGTLYLAIATLAFAELMQYVVFESDFGFSFGSGKSVPRLDLFGYHVESDAGYFVLTVVVFVAIGALVLWLRRGAYGRLLVALRDSPAACGTLGLNLTFTRIGVFGISAAIAGFAGGIYAQQQQTIGAIQFNIIQNLPLLLALVICGLTSVSGAALGGILLMVLTQAPQSISQFAFIAIGAGAMILGRFPNGLVSLAFMAGRAALGLNRSPGTAAPTEGQGTVTPTEGSRVEPGPGGIREEVTVGGRA